MSQHIRDTFAACKKEGRAAMVAFLTAGYPTLEETVPLMQALQAGGTDIIELGMPFSDPIADGPVIQGANTVALSNDVNLPVVLETVRRARAAGVRVPIMLMGYYNPIMHYGEEKFIREAAAVGANGFLIVDLPPEEAVRFRAAAARGGLSYIPLVAPSTEDERLDVLAGIADSFIYVVSRMGTTGSTGKLEAHLDELVARVRKHAGDVPLAVGFGISTSEHFQKVSASADGVVIGSFLISLIGDTPKAERPEAVRKYINEVVGGRTVDESKIPEFKPIANGQAAADEKTAAADDEYFANAVDRFGEFGGQYVPESLHKCLKQVEATWTKAKADPEFWKEYESYYPYMGRPSTLYFADRLTERIGGARIWLKREDLNHTGSHKINNAVGQALIAKRMGKTSVIAETGAGQHGVGGGGLAAKFGLKCTIYMGAEDARRQALNVFRMKLLGAEVVEVHNGTKTLRDAVSEALRVWVTRIDDTHYVFGTASGPYPFPEMVRTFQSVIGRETREEFERRMHKLPTALVACVGGGSNCSGHFSEFIPHKSVQLLGVEAGGDGVDTDKHAATLTGGDIGVLHGAKSYVLQTKDGQIIDTHSISAGLDYPGVGPELSQWKKSGRAKFVACTDLEALKGFRLLSETEGIIPAVESAHAIQKGSELAAQLGKDDDVVICLSGRGDKDVAHVAELLPAFGPRMGWDLRFEGN